MTQIEFFVLPDQHSEARDRYACLQIEEAYQRGRRVFVQAADEAHASQLDALLWSYRDSSFIPHSIIGVEPSAAVQIGFGDSAGDQHELLINLSNSVPPFFSRFEQVNEIVIQQDTVVEQTRTNYRHYKNHGYPLNHHNIRQRILSH